MPEDLEEDWNLIRPGRATPKVMVKRGRTHVQVEKKDYQTSTIWVGFFYENTQIGWDRIPIQLADPGIDGRRKPYFDVHLIFTPRSPVFIDEFRLYLSDIDGIYFTTYRGAIDAGVNHHASHTNGLRVSFRLRDDGLLSNVRIPNKVRKSRSGMTSSSYEEEDYYED